MYSEEDKTGNNERIKSLISQLGDDVTFELVSELLPKLLAEEKLIINTSFYNPASRAVDGVGRYLIYDHPDKTNPFSIWIFAFSHRQKTLIHDHKFKGTVTVLEGPVSEKFYQPTGEDKARLIERGDRYRFHCNKDDLSSPFVHQLKRRKALGEGTSVTLHIYQMEAHTLRFGSQVDSRNIYKYYVKDKILDKTEIPAYGCFV